MMLRLLIVCFLSGLICQVSAQYWSDNNVFSVPDEKACAPYVPVITSAFCAGGGCTFFPDINNPAFSRQLVSGEPVPDFSYEPGTYTMRVVSGADPNTQVIDFFTITIYANEPPDFNIYACSGNRVQLEFPDQGYPEYSIDYQNDGTPDDSAPAGLVNPFFSYPDATPQIISVRPNYTNCSASQKTFTPVSGAFPPTPAIIAELQVTANNSINLDFTKADNFYYQLDLSTNSSLSWSEYTMITDEPSLVVSGLNTNSNYYCFRMGTVNICDSPAPIFTGSNTICSADLDLSVQSDLMQLDWATSAAGVSSFTIVKDPGNSVSVGTAQPFRYNDTDVICGTPYSYQLIHEYPGGIRSYSRVVTGTAISNRTPTSIDNISSINNTTSVTLTWLQDPAFNPDTYRIFKITNSVSRLNDTTSDPTYTDNVFNIEDDICYNIQYTDVCGNQSDPGSVVCPIVLSAALEKDNTVTLEWSAYNGWATGVNRYEIEKYNAAGELVQTISTGVTTSYIDVNTNNEQIFSYRIRAIAADGSLVNSASLSNIRTVIKNPNLAHPSAFIPYSTINENRTFRVLGNFIQSYQLKIFNRWGELIFESFDKETGWDGTFRGQRMPEGTYVFQARITDQAGRSFDYAGTVVLLKKG